ncbi:MAG: hypothetical protein DRJ01_13030 [Bacteroidetes bacterium]|nr:MAG: hypothetical protein DRJ01_13030 [Bacteroidota bacterium]
MTSGFAHSANLLSNKDKYLSNNNIELNSENNLVLNKKQTVCLPNNNDNYTKINNLFLKKCSVLHVPANTTLEVDNITIAPGARLIVDGKLIVTNDVDMKKYSVLNISSRGNVDIEGNFTAYRHIYFLVTGKIRVYGDFLLMN